MKHKYIWDFISPCSRTSGAGEQPPQQHHHHQQQHKDHELINSMHAVESDRDMNQLSLENVYSLHQTRAKHWLVHCVDHKFLYYSHLQFSVKGENLQMAPTKSNASQVRRQWIAWKSDHQLHYLTHVILYWYCCVAGAALHERHHHGFQEVLYFDLSSNYILLIISQSWHSVVIFPLSVMIVEEGVTHTTTQTCWRLTVSMRRKRRTFTWERKLRTSTRRKKRWAVQNTAWSGERWLVAMVPTALSARNSRPIFRWDLFRRLSAITNYFSLTFFLLPWCCLCRFTFSPPPLEAAWG